MNDRIRALRRAVEAAPDDHSLRLLLAEELEHAGEARDAVREFTALLHAEALPGEVAVRAGHLALEVEDDVSLARAFLIVARDRGTIDGVATLERRIEAAMVARGAERLLVASADEHGPVPEEMSTVTFDDVGGLEDVKKVIHRQVILPQARGDLLQRYGRRRGGGVLLYGPPGCGKTLLARATAGECRVPFLNVRIEQVLDPFHGVSERNLHAQFEEARARAPSVLFIDELDAFGYARRKQRDNAPGRTLVDLLLQELDAIGPDNEGVLVLASTNAPWDVDDALLRPGRFDRSVFVPPPDVQARLAILRLLLSGIPQQAVDARRLARETELFSGADLRAVVDRAIDAVIDEALDTGTEPPVTGDLLQQAAAALPATTVAWLETARSYVEFANVGDRYRDVADYLARRSVRRHLGR